MTLLEYRTRILDAIGDPTKARYSDAVTAEGLRMALEEYSKANPQIRETTITVVLAGRDQILAGVIDLLYPLSVLFPVTVTATLLLRLNLIISTRGTVRPGSPSASRPTCRSLGKT
jgi:hypothetical protein